MENITIGIGLTSTSFYIYLEPKNKRQLVI